MHWIAFPLLWKCINTPSLSVREGPLLLQWECIELNVRKKELCEWETRSRGKKSLAPDRRFRGNHEPASKEERERKAKVIPQVVVCDSLLFLSLLSHGCIALFSVWVHPSLLFSLNTRDTHRYVLGRETAGKQPVCLLKKSLGREYASLSLSKVCFLLSAPFAFFPLFLSLSPLILFFWFAMNGLEGKKYQSWRRTPGEYFDQWVSLFLLPVLLFPRQQHQRKRSTGKSPEETDEECARRRRQEEQGKQNERRKDLFCFPAAAAQILPLGRVQSWVWSPRSLVFLQQISSQSSSNNKNNN